MSSEHETADLGSSGGRDPFAPASHAPAKTGGEWDAPAADPVQEIENQAWQYDQDAVDAEAAAQPIEAKEEAPETEEPKEETPVVEAAEDGPPVDASPRAQQRIRELAAERKASETENTRLREMLARLVESQQRSTALQERQHEEQAARVQAEKAKQSEADLLAKFKTFGFKDDSVSDWLAFEAVQKAEAAQRELAQFREADQRREREASVARYESTLRRELETQAKRFKIDESDVADLYEQAYAVARAKQIANPAEAVAKVLKPYTKLARPTPVATKRPDPNDPAHQAISARGRAAERISKPAKKIRDVEEIEREMGAGKLF